MKNFFTSLGPSAEASYAQVLDQVTLAAMMRSVADLSGSFARKMVAGREYWYYQYRDVNQRVQQIYVGQKNERLDKLIEKKLAGAASGVAGSTSRPARAAIALGNFAMTRSQFRVVKRLGEYGFFQAGGVLIGTHAYASYGNMLGVQWSDSAATQDVDFAYAGRSLSLALPTTMTLDVHDAISSLEMGFLPASRMDGLIGGSYVIPSQPDFRLDFLTTTGRDNSDLINFPNLNVAMIPMKFMEYSLEDIRQTAMLSEEGAFLVNVPSPARYALHKLIVAGERSGSFRTKASKDLRQSASLIAYFSRYHPEELTDAWTDLTGRGSGWRNRVVRGLGLLGIQHPDMAKIARELFNHEDDLTVEPVTGQANIAALKKASQPEK